MNQDNVDSRSMDLHRRIALVLRKEPGLVRDFAERLRFEIGQGKVRCCSQRGRMERPSPRQWSGTIFALD